jgi:hypothetical protein
MPPLVFFAMMKEWMLRDGMLANSRLFAIVLWYGRLT